MTELDKLEREHNYIRLATPQCISKQHWLEGTVPLVSIWCITYNHVHFIRDAIEGFLIQKTTFPVEILIHDDASTDGTTEIVREYQARFPQLIKAICQSENQFSQGKKLFDIACQFVKGSFISICEGDDYWTNANKLETQIELLMLNKDFNFCFHKALLHDHGLIENTLPVGNYIHQNNKVNFQDILTRSSGIIPTSSYVIRTSQFIKISLFVDQNKYLINGDVVIQQLGSYDIGALYIDEFMSVYRYRVANSWTEMYSSNYQLKTAVHISTVKYFLTLKDYFDNKYGLLLNILIFDQIFRLMLHIKNKDFILYNSLNDKFKRFLEKLFKDLALETSDLIIYSSGTATEWVLDNIVNIQVNKILDSDIQKNQTFIRGLKVYHPASLPAKAFENKFILITLWDRTAFISDLLVKEYNVDRDHVVNLNIEAHNLAEFLELLGNTDLPM